MEGNPVPSCVVKCKVPSKTLDLILCFTYLSTDSFLAVRVSRRMRWNIFLFHVYKGEISCYSPKGSIWSEISTSLKKNLLYLRSVPLKEVANP